MFEPEVIQSDGGVSAPGSAAALLQAMRSWESLCARLPIGLYACDAAGVIVQYNARAAELWGREPRLGDTEQRFCGAQKLLLPDGSILPFAETPMAEVLRTGVAARDQEVTIERPDGSRLPVLVNIDPIFEDGGNLAGAINCFQDISRLKQAEDELRERERWYRGLLEALPAAIYTTDAQGRITFYNQAAVELSGSRPEIGSDKWCVSWRLYNPDGSPLPHDECPMAVALKEGRPVRGAEAVAERPNGDKVPFIPYPTPLYDASGAISGAVNMLVDITERKRAEGRQKQLIDELNHRVKNTLATVQSLARQTLRGTDCPEEVCDAFEARLFALSQAHDQLTREGWQGADLKSIMAATFAPYQICPGDRAYVEGPSVQLGPQAAVALTMVFHELATNAVKYGSLSVPSGQVAVWWSLARGKDGSSLRIDWQESGGPAVGEPTRCGFGSRLLERAVTRVLRGSAGISFEPCGVRCNMEIPLSYVHG